MASNDNSLIYQDYRPIPGWALLLFLVALAAILLGFGAISAVLGPLFTVRDLIAILALFYATGLCAVALGVAPMGRAALPALGLRSAGWRPIVFGVIGTLVLSVAVSQLGIEPKAMKEAIDLARRPGTLVISLLVLAAMAPLVEELVFRGLLYGWIAGRWNSIAAWIVSSLAFAAAHYEPAHVILVLPLGFLFGYLRRRTDSLWPSLCAHIVNNGFAVLAAAYLDI